MLKGKVIIITGATSGIGQACAEVFGSTGAHIVITGRNKDKLKNTESSLIEKSIDHLAILADVSNEEDNKKMVKQTLDKYGKIDILVNNAGITMRAMFNELDIEVFKKVMDINFYGTVYATKYCLPEILKQKGAIVGVSSVNGFRGTPARTAYSASKYAMQGFFEALRTEVMNTGVHILVVCPGYTGTNIRNTALTANGKSQQESPLDENKMMSAEEVAKSMLKALKNKKRDLVLTSQGKLVYFLNKWVPEFMDKMVYNHMAKEKDNPLDNN